MKNLTICLTLISFNCFSMAKIEVTDLLTNKLVAGDEGDRVTVNSLRSKMLKHKNLDIMDSSKYLIVTTDTTSRHSKEVQDKKDKKDAEGRIKNYDCTALSGFQKDVCILLKR